MKFFKKEELACPCCGSFVHNNEALCKLDLLRSLVNRPLYINSAYRCPKHNASVGGSTSSQHMLGTAFDIKASFPSERAELITCAFLAGFSRVIVYKNFVHVDTKGDKKLLWVGDYEK